MIEVFSFSLVLSPHHTLYLEPMTQMDTLLWPQKSAADFYFISLVQMDIEQNSIAFKSFWS